MIMCLKVAGAAAGLAAVVLGLAAPAVAQTPWKPFDQARAVEESLARVAAGKDPIPGPRTCFFRYGPSSGDPYINIAYPDAATFYWGALFTTPPGARLRLEGRFPHARYISFISYDGVGAPIDSVADYLITPRPGSTNPYIEGANRKARQRDWSLEIVDAQPEKPVQWGVYLKGETREKLAAPSFGDGRQQSVLYRIYAGDKGTDETGGAGLPVPVLTLADGRELRGAAACAQLRVDQPMQADAGALALPLDRLRKLQAEAQAKFGPNHPATLPPTWWKASEDMSRFAVYTGQTTPEPGVRRRDGTFYANLDNQYLRTFVSRNFGKVFVIRAKAPTTPRTFNGDAAFGGGELRYWSWCSNQGFGTARVNACLFDEQIPRNANGMYTLVLSRVEDRPRNAIPECGVAWLPMADIGDGTGDENMTLLTLRHMLGSGPFKQAIQNVPSQDQAETIMGPYFPRGRYTTTSAFETAIPCLLETRE